MAYETAQEMLTTALAAREARVPTEEDANVAATALLDAGYGSDSSGEASVSVSDAALAADVAEEWMDALHEALVCCDDTLVFELASSGKSIRMTWGA